MVKNPNYWGYDERYPQNRLPYVNTLKVLIIPDENTALSAVRSGKIDAIDQISMVQSPNMKKSNPEMVQIPIPQEGATVLQLRNDRAPYTDVKVRKALQMALDLPGLAKSYYSGNADPVPSTLTSNNMEGWGYPYSEWPQDLKDEYTFNVAASKKLLAEAGYPSGFKTNIVAQIGVDMDLLQIVKSSFMDVGVDMEIRPMEATAWVAFVQTNQKHDQIVQRVGSSLGLVSEPLRQIGQFKSNQAGSYECVNDPVYDAFVTKALASSSITEVKQLFRDANIYVARQHFAISLLTPNKIAFCQPWLKGYNGQYDSISGGVGAHQLGFFNARFWVDQTLKKSLGH